MPKGRTTSCLKQDLLCLTPLCWHLQIPTCFFQHLSSPAMKQGQYWCCCAETKLRASESCFFAAVDITDVNGCHWGKASVFSHAGSGAHLNTNTASLCFPKGSILQRWCCQTGVWGENAPIPYCCGDCRALCGELCTAEEIAGCRMCAMNGLFAPALR